MLLASACGGDERGDAEAVVTLTPPEVVAADLQVLFTQGNRGLDPARIERVGRSGDARHAWLIADLMRFYPENDTRQQLQAAFHELTGTEPGTHEGWQAVTDYLIASDLQAPDGYVELQRQTFEFVEPSWEPFFDDPNGDVDWRVVSWGGVRIDDREIARADEGCDSCIPSLNDPGLTGVDGGDWYPDERTVFAVEVNGEFRAYPKNIMEVHEMVNDTLGGRRIALAYCTLCGTAQAFFTDELPEGVETPTGTLELRTSGLLSRSNKVMYELQTFSMFDTFRGRAVTGPLHDAGLVLEQISVATTTWGDWKAAHPETTVVAEDGGIGRRYSLDPLRGRDDGGPIFPIGDVDPRLPVQEQVLGVKHEGVVVAFPELDARVTLSRGGAVEFGGIVVVLDAGALRAVAGSGEAITTHQAFWFAWSQFNPETEVWRPG
jgi:Protein of unknown function (DUF3179)